MHTPPYSYCLRLDRPTFAVITRTARSLPFRKAQLTLHRARPGNYTIVSVYDGYDDYERSSRERVCRQRAALYINDVRQRERERRARERGIVVTVLVDMAYNQRSNCTRLITE